MASKTSCYTRGVKTERQEAYERYSRATDPFLMVLALAMIPLIAAPFLFTLSEPLANATETANWFIWAVFAGDYITRLYLSPRRSTFIRTHIPDLLIVLIPFLRPLRLLRSARVLRLLRVGRASMFLIRGLRDVRRILTRRGVTFVLLVVTGLVFVAGILVLELERGAEGANIKSYAEGLWWAATTITTVGYGDRFPVTAGGRGIAVLLMIGGITLFGVLTASIAAFFVEREADPAAGSQMTEIVKRLERIESRLKANEELPR